MISPAVDTICIGALSIVVCVALVAFAPRPLDKHLPAIVPLLLTVGITWPHFLSSYRLLYATRTSILTYRRASIYFPLALGAYGVFAVIRAPTNAFHVHLLNLIASVYLARHYAGQTWGMMASFAHIERASFTPWERRLFLRALDLIMLWHICWASTYTIGAVAPSLEAPAHRIYGYIDVIGVVSFAMGLAAFGSMIRRRKLLPPARVFVPWLTIYGWYVLLRKDATAMVIVQAAHALQYLIFPLRIEETRRAPRTVAVNPWRATRWIVGLVVIGLAAFGGLPSLFELGYHRAGGVGEQAVAFVAVLTSFVNIHHYFIDGSLYKLRNPAVRRDLFAHLGES
jgi:hypothetical protein